jgi:hypothetical protein
MKAIAYCLLPLWLFSCCLGNRKCRQGNNSATFRLVDAVNGNDLVFGPTSIYNKDSLRFFSLEGTDTIVHYYRPNAYSNLPQDSLLFVTFSSSQVPVVFVQLSNSDTDTLRLNYALTTTDCCGDISDVSPETYNNNLVENGTNGISTIKK